MIGTSRRPLISPTIAFHDDDYPEVKAVERLLSRYGEPQPEEQPFHFSRTKEGQYKDKIMMLGEDIIRLRRQIQDLESDKDRMRKEILDDEKTKELLIKNVKLQNVDKTELIDRYVTLKRQLSFQNSELQDYKDIVMKLKTEVTKRREAAYGISERTYWLEQRIRETLKKEKSLTSKCNDQESTIMNLKKMLEEQSHRKDLERGERNVLLDENQRLKDEISELKKKQFEKIVDATSRLAIQEKLEKAKVTVRSLEEQLTKKGQQWAQEKAHLQMRLREYELGLFHPSTTRSLDYYPRKTQRKHRHLDDYEETEGNRFLPPLHSRRNKSYDYYAY